MEGPSGQTEAASAAPKSASDKVADMEEYLFEGEEEEDQPEDEGEAEEGDDLDLEDDEAGEDEDEPEAAIDPPASLNAEEKKAFAQLPPEAQQAWAASETRRNTQVQEATTKASVAQRDAEARAAQSDAEAKALYGQQLGEFVKAFEPQRPNPLLAQQDPARYIAEQAHFEALKAQHDELVQHVQAIGSEAETAARTAFVENRNRELLTIPEIANPETREGYLDRAYEVAQLLGYSPETLAKEAGAQDIKAMAQVAEWKAKAERLDKAMASKMQKVRAGKQRSNKPGAAPHADKARAGGGQAWQRVKVASSREAKDAAFADYLGL